MPQTLLNTTELLVLIRSKNRTGGEALYDQYAIVLRFAIYRFVRQKDCTDLVLEKAICKIWDTVDQYNDQEVPLLTWMLAIAKAMAAEFNGKSLNRSSHEGLNIIGTKLEKEFI